MLNICHFLVPCLYRSDEHRTALSKRLLSKRANEDSERSLLSALKTQQVRRCRVKQPRACF